VAAVTLFIRSLDNMTAAIQVSLQNTLDKRIAISYNGAIIDMKA
jgi:hypothetical protein